jgi:uncharacterized protein
MRLVDLVGIQLDITNGVPMLLLREHEAPHRVLPIFIGGPEAAAIAMAMSGQTALRPMTHDVMATIVEMLEGRVDAAEISERRDGAFLAHLALTGPAGELRLDTRPFDAIALAVRSNAPVYVSEQVLDEAGKLVPDELDDQLDVEGEIDKFRAFLDELDPADFLSDEADLGQRPYPEDGPLHRADQVLASARRRQSAV